MKVLTALDKIRQMDPTGVLLVKGADGRWTRVEDVQFARATDVGIYAPTTLLLDGVRYVREDLADQHPANDATGYSHEVQ